MRRRTCEWTLEPKSIQSQRAQLARLLETFHFYPTAGVTGNMASVRERLSSNSFIGTFPYPTIYPSSMESVLPVATTQWCRFGSFWQYTGYGDGASAYTIAFIVVDVTTNPGTPTVKTSGIFNAPQSTAARMETIFPVLNGAQISFASSSSTVTPTWGVLSAFFNPNDEFYVCMAFCYEDIPYSPSNKACLSYYTEPSAVLKPQVG